MRAAVVGVGHLGYHHARVYRELEGVELVGVADINSERRDLAARDFATRAFANVSDLLAEGVGAASVAVPTLAHHEVAIRLLEAGVDVLVEKPIAASVKEAAVLVRKANECGRLLQVGHVERFNGAVMALFDAIRDPRFIECHRLSPYPNRGDDVSVVLDLMIHDLEIIRALVGADIDTVDAVGVPVFSPYEDIANARLRFATGCVANITCSRVSFEKLRKIRIFSGEAYVSTDYGAQEVLVYRKKPGAAPRDGNPMERIEIESLPVHKEEPLKRELASFVQCVRTRSRPLVAGEDGLAALELAERVVRSIRESP